MMKKFIAISLALNLVLVLVWAVTRSPLPSGAPVPPSRNDGAPSGEGTDPFALATQLVVITNPAPPFTWQFIQSTNYRTLIANLRAAECPEETIRDLIMAEVSRSSARRRNAQRNQKEFKFWQNEQDGTDWVAENRKRRQTEKETEALIAGLLGPEAVEEMKKLNGDARERQFGFLSPEKMRSVLELQEQFQEAEQAFYQKTKGFWDGDDQVEFKKIKENQRQELAKFLSPQELEEFDLRNSQTAGQLRYEVADMETSEQEFRALFRIRKQFEDQLSAVDFDPEDKVATEKRRQAEKALNEQVKSSLGESRFKEFERAKDWDYKNLVRLADRNNLPRDTAGKIYDMKKEADAAASKVKTDASLSPEERRRLLGTIRSETEKAFGETLGDKALGSYKKNNGWWFENLGR